MIFYIPLTKQFDFCDVLQDDFNFDTDYWKTEIIASLPDEDFQVFVPSLISIIRDKIERGEKNLALVKNKNGKEWRDIGFWSLMKND